MSESRGLSALQVVQRKKEKRRANNKRLKKFQLLGVELIQDAHGNGGIIVFLSTATRFQIRASHIKISSLYTNSHTNQI